MAKNFGPRVSSTFDYLIHESGKIARAEFIAEN
jgi:hypothetical protein